MHFEKDSVINRQRLEYKKIGCVTEIVWCFSLEVVIMTTANEKLPTTANGMHPTFSGRQPGFFDDFLYFPIIADSSLSLSKFVKPCCIKMQTLTLHTVKIYRKFYGISCQFFTGIACVRQFYGI